MTDRFDPLWPHGHTTEGLPARVVCTDAAGKFPVVAMVMVRPGQELPFSFTEDGHEGLDGANPALDLINAPAPKRRLKGWIALQESIAGPRGHFLARVYFTREQALVATRRECLAVFEFDVEEGEGL